MRDRKKEMCALAEYTTIAGSDADASGVAMNLVSLLFIIGLEREARVGDGSLTRRS